MRRVTLVVGMLLAVLGAAAPAPRPAAANHFFNSTKSCTAPAAGIGNFECLLTLGPSSDDPLFAGPTETVTVDAVGGTFTFVGATVVGGNCPAQVTSVSPTQVQLQALQDCGVGFTIQLQETLAPTAAGGAVCQILHSTFNSPPFTACAAGFVTPGPAPASAEDCKKGGWQAFGVFKNQGDCVSFVETGGRNEPAGG